MSTYNNISNDWYVTVDNGNGTVYINGSLNVTGNITYVSELAVNDAFILAGANNNASANVTSVGFLAGKPTTPISYAGLRYDAVTGSWQISTDVYANGEPISAYANITTGASYSNADVAAYLPTYSGNISANNIDTTGNITGNVVVANFLKSDDSTAMTVQDGLSIDGDLTAVQTTTPPLAFAELVAVSGSRAFVNDGNLVAANNFGQQISGGGSNVVPVWSDGVNWYVG